MGVVLLTRVQRDCLGLNPSGLPKYWKRKPNQTGPDPPALEASDLQVVRLSSCHVVKLSSLILGTC